MRKEIRPGADLSFKDLRSRSHHTIHRPDIYGMTYGGLHETRKGVEEAREKIAAGYPDNKASWLKAVRKWREAPIIELQPGQEYEPWGTWLRPYRHGINDGTHGSTIPEGEHAPHLLTEE